MRISTDALVEGVAAVAALHDVEPARLSGDEAAVWLARVAQVRRATDAILASLAQRIDELSPVEPGSPQFARAKGFAGTAALVASVGDLAFGEAGKLVGLGRTLASAYAGSVSGDGPAADAVVQFRALAAAVWAGQIGSEKATVIRRTLEDISAPDIDLENVLVNAATRMDFAALRGLCLRELARRDYGALREREMRQRRERSLRFFDEPDGMVAVHGKLDAQTAAPVRAWIEAEVRRCLGDQRDVPVDEQRSAAQIAADSLGAMARHLLGCTSDATGVKTTLVVQIRKEDVESGVGLAQCDGLPGPVSIEALRSIAVDAEVLPAVMGAESVPLDFGRARRLFSRSQRLALAVRDGGCAKCGAPASRCDVHHIRWWSQGGKTDVDNGVLMCVGCHHRLHDYGWGIEVVGGEVWFIPPATVDPERRARPAYGRHWPSPASLVAA